MKMNFALPGALICIAVLLAGCQRNVVQRGANQLAATVPTLYYEQVLDNLARTISNPNSLPYFGVPAQGTHTNSRQLQATYMLGLDLNAASHWLLDKQTAAFGGQVQNQESFQLQPVTNPDKILLMQIAYWQATAYPHGPDLDILLRRYYSVTNNFVDYNPYVKSGWFVVTNDKKAAKKKGCYAACCGHTYVYVPAENMDTFSKFTLAILDIATLDTDYFYGVKKSPDEQPPGKPERLPSPRINPRPFPAPPVAPSL